MEMPIGSADRSLPLVLHQDVSPGTQQPERRPRELGTSQERTIHQHQVTDLRDAINNHEVVRNNTQNSKEGDVNSVGQRFIVHPEHRPCEAYQQDPW